MPRDRRQVRRSGDFGERVAASFLEARGYTILERNWSVREGEIDIIAGKPDELIFVEVRTRRSKALVGPAESIDARKARHLLVAAQAYVQQHPDAPENQRIDAVVIELDAKGRVLRVEQIENAVEGE